MYVSDCDYFFKSMALSLCSLKELIVSYTKTKYRNECLLVASSSSSIPLHAGNDSGWKIDLRVSLVRCHVCQFLHSSIIKWLFRYYISLSLSLSLFLSLSLTHQHYP